MTRPLTLLRSMRSRLIQCMPRRLRAALHYSPGHFYSPLLDLKDFDPATGRLPGDDESTWERLDLNAAGQQDTYAELLQSTKHLPFPERAIAGFRYHRQNHMFVPSDAFVLSGMLQRLHPRRVIEVGAGFSSAVMLDTADHCGLQTQFTFIEILPQRLQALLTPQDATRVTLERQPVQRLAPVFFDVLERGDILFIDSSHVAKIGSDVVFLLLRILPRLQPGVFVHIHDMFYPHSYPREWLLQGRAWNESLFVRAFLTQNPDFRFHAFNAFAATTFPDLFRQHLPSFLDDPGGSLWLEKIN